MGQVEVLRTSVELVLRLVLPLFRSPGLGSSHHIPLINGRSPMLGSPIASCLKIEAMRWSLLRDLARLLCLGSSGLCGRLNLPRLALLEGLLNLLNIRVIVRVAERSLVTMDPPHMIQHVPTATEATTRHSTFTARVPAEMWTLSMTMGAMSFPFMAEPTSS